MLLLSGPLVVWGSAGLCDCKHGLFHGHLPIVKEHRQKIGATF